MVKNIVATYLNNNGINFGEQTTLSEEPVYSVEMDVGDLDDDDDLDVVIYESNGTITWF